jgi:drug/metabolite transporter (DMT)-like permease
LKPRDLAELVLLAALWGASFLFMKLGAFEFGAVALVAVRVGLAALALLPLVAYGERLAELRSHWKALAFVGVCNSALPFVGFAFAVQHITAGLSAIFNATAPLWGAVVAWAWLGDRPGGSRIVGLVVGFAGIVWLGWDKAGLKPGSGITDAALAVLACLAATLCYGIGASVAKKRLAGVAPLTVAAGSQLFATLALALPAFWWWPPQPPSGPAWLAAALLGLLCTAFAYLLYFRLIAHVGPAKAISVTFLIPLFGVLWGAVFLAEPVTPVMLSAGMVILAGTALATGVISVSRRAAA